MPAAADRRWGFHRLVEPHPSRLVRDAGVGAGDLVLDLGAGDGALTAPLARTGACVIAFELHPGRAERLRRTVGRLPNVEVVRADIADLRLPRRPFQVVANPPFAATTATLRRLTAPGSRLTRADLVVPAHLATRWASGRAPGAGRWFAEFDLQVARVLPRSAFRPAGPPAAVLVIRRAPQPS